MADLTLCEGIVWPLGYTCPWRNECYRHKAKPDPSYQSFFASAPLDLETDTCAHFIEFKQAQEKRI